MRFARHAGDRHPGVLHPRMKGMSAARGHRYFRCDKDNTSSSIWLLRGMLYLITNA